MTNTTDIQDVDNEPKKPNWFTRVRTSKFAPLIGLGLGFVITAAVLLPFVVNDTHTLAADKTQISQLHDKVSTQAKQINTCGAAISAWRTVAVDEATELTDVTNSFGDVFDDAAFNADLSTIKSDSDQTLSDIAAAKAIKCGGSGSEATTGSNLSS